MPKRVKSAFTSAAGTPRVQELAVVAHAGAQDADLDRVEHAPVPSDALEAVPAVAGLHAATAPARCTSSSVGASSNATLRPRLRVQ